MKVARFAAAVFAVLAVAGCGGRAATASGASHPATARPSSLAPAASPSSDGAAFCARVKAAVDPETAYLSAVIDRDNLISTFSTASPADNERAARAEVAGWIAVYCPKYAYLTKSS